MGMFARLVKGRKMIAGLALGAALGGVALSQGHGTTAALASAPVTQPLCQTSTTTYPGEYSGLYFASSITCDHKIKTVRWALMWQDANSKGVQHRDAVVWNTSTQLSLYVARASTTSLTWKSTFTLTFSDGQSVVINA